MRLSAGRACCWERGRRCGDKSQFVVGRSKGEATMNGHVSRRTVLRTTAALAGAALAGGHAVTARAADVAWLGQIQQSPASLAADAPKLNDILVDERGQKITDLA